MNAFLEASKKWQHADAENFKSEMIQRLVTRAYHHVPFYRHKLRKNGVDIEKLRGVEDLSVLPLLCKDDLRSSIESDLRPDNIEPSQLVRVMSGGTTGLPTVFFHSRNSADAAFNAFRIFLWQKCGYEPSVRALDLTWAFDGPPIRFNPYMNWLSISISQLQPEKVKASIERLVKFRPHYIIGYPSTVELFVQILSEYKIELAEIHGVITGSEMLYATQRETIRSAFGAPILQWYGLSELAGFAFSCGDNGIFHFLPQAGCMELIGEDGFSITNEGIRGEIVLTGFHGGGTPFIRYRTGDWATKGPQLCPICGHDLPSITMLTGRTQDYLLSANQRIPLSVVNSHTDAFRNVWKYQFHQRRRGHVDLRLVIKDGYGTRDEAAINRLLVEKLGEAFKWNLVIVPEIPPTSRGKHKFLIQEIPFQEKSNPTIS